MNIFLLASILNTLIIGAVSSYTDMRRGKIYNKFLGAGFIACLLILAVFYGRSFDAQYLGRVAVNGSISVVTGYLLWFYRKWSAGDAKLFSFYAFSVPHGFYQGHYIRFFPSINILLNVFIIVILYIFFHFLMFAAKRLITKGFTVRRGPPDKRAVFDFLKVAANFFFIVYLVSQLSSVKPLAPLVSNNLAVFFAVFFLYSPLIERKKIMNIVSAVSAVIAVYLLVFETGIFRSVVYKALIYVVLIRVIQYCFDFYIRHMETVEVRVRDLKNGQILLESEKTKIRDVMRRAGRQGEYSETVNYGLNAGQIAIIKDLYREDDVLKVYKTFSFAPLLFAGVLLTLITGDSLIHMIKVTVAGWQG